jgi:hypothetical protein
MRIGQIIRYASATYASPNEQFVDGLLNWFFVTASPKGTNWKSVILGAGINTSAILDKSKQGSPFIVVRSSPNKFGTDVTPWEDTHRPDLGYIKYYGDSKGKDVNPRMSLGNSRLLDAYEKYSGSFEDRLIAPPIVALEGVPYDGRVKGQFIFNGVGLITKVEEVLQKVPRSHSTFLNYLYEVKLIDLTNENNEFSWNWINARRNPNLSPLESLDLAPKAWKNWVLNGF